MVTTKGKTAAAGICLFVGLYLTFALAQSDATTRVAAIAQAQDLHQLFVAEANPYIRAEYIKQLPAVLKRFGAKGSEQWVDDLLDRGVGDSKAEVVVTAIRHIGSMQKAAFIDRLVAMYGTVGKSQLGLSSGPIRCEIIKVLKQYPADPRVSALLTQIITEKMMNPMSQEIRLTVAVMGQSGNQNYLVPLRTYISSIQARKNGLQEKIKDPQLPKDEKSIYEYRISSYASLLGQAETSVQKLTDSQGGAK